MSIIIKGANVYLNNEFVNQDLFIDDNGVLFEFENQNANEVINASNLTIMPGFIDPHVHLREPGFEYKETIFSGTSAAAAGGFTTIFSMPNLKPAPDCFENLKVQLDIIKKDAQVHVYPTGSITKSQKGVGELSDFESLADYVIGFSDDGVGVQTKELMHLAMQKAAKLNKAIIAHCEDNNELEKGHCINYGIVSQRLGLVGINNASEYNEVIRDIELAKQTNCHLHICHVSAKESVEAIRQAKKDGVNVTAEVTVHHLVLSEEDIKEHGNYKMNPPLRSEYDRQALIDGVLDGTIDMICTDHAPHSQEEKSRGLQLSPFGIIGLETAFPLIYTYFVKRNIITLNKAIELFSKNCAKTFNIEGGTIEFNKKANFCAYNLDCKHIISEDDLLSKSHNTPFINFEVACKNALTVVDGKIVFRKDI